jgi:acyl carrier protein
MQIVFKNIFDKSKLSCIILLCKKGIFMNNISENEFKDVLCELLCLDKDNVTLNTKLGDLCLDSLDYMQLFYDIEKKFNVEISEAVFNQIDSKIDIKDLFELTIKNLLLA